MRKVDPEDVYFEFTGHLEELDLLLDLLLDEVLARVRVRSLQTRMAELSMLGAVVQWDEFISKLFVALVNRDASRFAEHLNQRVRDYVTDTFGQPTAERVTVAVPEHPSKGLTEKLLDRKGYVPAYDAKELERRARQRFVGQVAARFKLKPDERAAIDAWRAFRDFVAHRSPSALSALNEALSSTALPVALREAGLQAATFRGTVPARHPTGER